MGSDSTSNKNPISPIFKSVVENSKTREICKEHEEPPNYRSLMYSENNLQDSHHVPYIIPTSSNFLRLHRNQDVVSLLKRGRINPYPQARKSIADRNGYTRNALQNFNGRITNNVESATNQIYKGLLEDQMDSDDTEHQDRTSDLLHKLQHLNIFQKSKFRVRFTDEDKK